jgi:hypothetical protein
MAEERAKVGDLPVSVWRYRGFVLHGVQWSLGVTGLWLVLSGQPPQMIAGSRPWDLKGGMVFALKERVSTWYDSLYIRASLRVL